MYRHCYRLVNVFWWLSAWCPLVYWWLGTHTGLVRFVSAAQLLLSTREIGERSWCWRAALDHAHLTCSLPFSVYWLKPKSIGFKALGKLLYYAWFILCKPSNQHNCSCFVIPSPRDLCQMEHLNSLALLSELHHGSWGALLRHPEHISACSPGCWWHGSGGGSDVHD